MKNISKALFVDHRDSFSGNLAAALSISGLDFDSIQDHNLPSHPSALVELASQYSALVLSPGPGTPSEYPKSAQLFSLGFASKPVLGVCLGLQIVLHACGFTVERIAANPIHGRTCCLQKLKPSRFLQNNNGTEFCFNGSWVFYNSLGCTASDETLANGNWFALAREDSIIAAVEHRHNKHVLVQFHPESFASVNGQSFIQAFAKSFCHITTRSTENKSLL